MNTQNTTNQTVTGKVNEPREVVQLGWDGMSQPIFRYKDELALSEHLQTRLTATQTQSGAWLPLEA